MFELFKMGGPLFMSLITIVFLSGMVVAVRSLISINTGATASTKINIGYVRSLGLLALVLGVLGQLIGLYSAFVAIEEMGAVSPALLAGGLKVSSITTIWGLICYALSLLVALGLSAFTKKEA